LATEKLTVPFPLPDPPELTVIHGAWPDTVVFQPQPAPVVTPTLLDPPSASIVSCVGVMLKAQPPA